MGNKRTNQYGGAFVEGVIVLPLFLLFLLFVVEVSILLLRYTAIHEGISIAAREISLPQKNSQIVSGSLPICNEIVSIRINEQMRAFKQSMNPSDFEILVKEGNPQELRILTNAKVVCTVCNALFGATYAPFTWNFEEAVILQDKLPPCQVDG